VERYGEVPLVDGDEGRLEQVFVNLLVNAAQAIPEGHADRNEIRISTWTDAAGDAVVEISDTGAGIPPEIRDRIFDPFFTTKPVGIGTGLGLSICRGIVTKLGGELSVESEVNRGTCFRVTLPRARPAGAAAPSPSAAPDALRQILIVDDDALVTSSLRRLLADGHDVEVAGSVDGALRRIAAKRFDLILCDLMMPDLTGMDLHERVLRDHSEQAERLLFMSAGAFTSRAREFVAARPASVLEKPLDLDRLLAVVHDRLQPAQA
jgi:CheY-like chemotaxis protein